MLFANKEFIHSFNTRLNKQNNVLIINMTEFKQMANRIVNTNMPHKRPLIFKGVNKSFIQQIIQVNIYLCKPLYTCRRSDITCFV